MHKQNSAPPADDWLPLNGIDHIELYVGNARQAAHYYRTAFGFTPIAYAGPETGVRDRISFVVQQGDVRLVLTSPLYADGPVAEHIHRHGDGIKDIALAVDDVESAFHATQLRGARSVLEPHMATEDDGRVTKATVAAFGDTVHSFVARQDYRGAFWPGYRALNGNYAATPVGVFTIDHVAVGVEPGTVEQWADYYSEVLGFQRSLEEDIATEYSAMNSKVVQSRAGRVITVLVEPAPGKRKSPIEEYLTYYIGAGVHHIALATDNIVKTVGALRTNGVEFTTSPATYYEQLLARIGDIPEDIGVLRDLSILVDRDNWGYLLQIFSRHVQSRPTFFFEIIQRIGARGFGSGNIKALFEAIEREQLLRGNA
jgi:4-hydroxyphenylpyruvate dioxygenase